jgi:succinate-acetate transporter protein
VRLGDVLKVIIGILVVIAGIWTMADPAWFGQKSWLYGLNWWTYTADIIRGSLGPLLILVGIVIVWIAYEESKV